VEILTLAVYAMRLEQLQAFLAVAETGSFQQAARSAA
jgi:hypothetical protein